MHMSYFLVKHFVSLELYNVCLRTTGFGHETFPPFTWAQVTLTFVGQASYSVLEVFFTHYPLGDFICFPPFSLVSSISAVEKVSGNLKCS